MGEFGVISLIRETASAISQEFELFLTAIVAVMVNAYAAGSQLGTATRIVL